jgi:hypothetical protein
MADLVHLKAIHELRHLGYGSETLQRLGLHALQKQRDAEQAAIRKLTEEMAAEDAAFVHKAAKPAWSRTSGKG